MTTITRRFITTRELAKFLGISYPQLRTRAQTDPIPIFKIGTRKGKIDTLNPEFHKWLDRFLGWEGAGAASVSSSAGPSLADMLPPLNHSSVLPWLFTFLGVCELALSCVRP